MKGEWGRKLIWYPALASRSGASVGEEAERSISGRAGKQRGLRGVLGFSPEYLGEVSPPLGASVSWLSLETVVPT